MTESKRNIVESANTWQITKYRYITSGKNWSWGRSTRENWLWSSLIVTTCVAFTVGAAAGAWVGLKIWALVASSNMAWWLPVLWTVILALALGMLLTIGVVRLMYYFLQTIGPMLQNLDDTTKN